MTPIWRCWFWKLGLVSFIAMGGAIIASSSDCANAQITPDGTLGAESSVVTPNVDINGVPSDRIDGGAIRGANLFHSFQEFNIGQGEGAFFTNPAGIENILSRVTGANFSNILGTLGVLGNANLFLFNPNGINFGADASLNVNGSFVGTTANAIQFGNQGFFSASAPDAPPLLTVNPSALLFNQIAAAPIAINSRREIGEERSYIIPPLEGLKVPDGKSLLVVGGNVRLDGGVLQAPGGRVELGGVSGAGTVGLQVDGNNLSLSFPDGTARADVALTQFALVDVIGGGGGSIAVNARNLDVLETSRVAAGIGIDLGTAGIEAGDITLNATGVITVSQEADIFNISDGIGNAGDINILAGSLLMNDTGEIFTYVEEEGNPGNISVQTNDSVSLVGLSTIKSNPSPSVDPNGQVNTGNISVQANGSVSLANSSITTSGYGQGDAGNVSVQANGSVSLADRSQILTNKLGEGDNESGSVGDAGSVSVQANGSVSLADRSQILTTTRGQGDAGSVSVQANGSVSLANTSEIVTSAYGQGDAGNVSVLAFDSVSLADRSQILTSTYEQGDAGSLSVQANGSVSLADSSSIFTNTYGQGDAGDISVLAFDSVSLANSILGSNIGSNEASAQGNGGDIYISTRSVFVTEGAELITRTFSSGDAGDIQVNASDVVEISGRVPFPPPGYWPPEAGYYSGFLTSTEEGARGSGGEINVTTGTLRVSDGATLSAQSSSDFRAGDITVNANVLEVTGGGQLLTNALSSGDAGDITVNVADRITISGSNPDIRDLFNRVTESEFEVRETAEEKIPHFIPASGVPASGLFANTSENSTGQGGNLTITTGQLNVRDGAEVAVSSLGLGDAGNLEISSRNLLLDNRGALRATSVSGRGGNISLQQDLIQMRNNSEISVTAGPNGYSGNLYINTDFLIAAENSDLIINLEGFRGSFAISTQGFFLSPDSDIIIGAGEELVLQNIYFSFGELAAPPEVVDVAGLIPQSCPASVRSGESKFIITGRGGLPPNPNDPLTGEALLTTWATLDPDVENRSSAEQGATNLTRETAPTQIVEANGWVINNKGEVVLIATAPTATLDIPWVPDSDCHAPEPSVSYP